MLNDIVLKTIQHILFQNIFILLIVLKTISLPANAVSNCQKMMANLNQLSEVAVNGYEFQPNEELIFDIYLQLFFGTHDKGTDKGLKDVHKILKKYPNLTKELFTEYIFEQEKRKYEQIPEVATLLQDQKKHAGGLKAKIFHPEANIVFWKEFLGVEKYTDKPIRPKGNLSSEESLKYKQKLKAWKQAKKEELFKKIYGVIPKTFYTEFNKHDVINTDLILIVFRHLKKYKSKLKKKDRQPVSQLMADLIHYAGFIIAENDHYIRSKNASENIEALRRVLNFRDNLAIELGYTQDHFDELISDISPSQVIEFSSLSEAYSRYSLFLESAPFEITEKKSIKVRSLSTFESAFRSCPGGDCSSGSYFEKAFDPNYFYFTLTYDNNHSDGALTIVLGKASDSKGSLINVAFVDKIQNVSNSELLTLLEGARLALQEIDYTLGLPLDVGDHNGISNELITRTKMSDLANMPGRKILNNFTPDEHQYHQTFDNGYTLAYDKHNVALIESPLVNHSYSIKHIDTTKAEPLNLDGDLFVKYFLSLKDSNKEEELLDYVNGYAFIEILQKKKYYTKQKFKKDLIDIIYNSNISIRVRKKAFIKLVTIFKNFSGLETFQGKDLIKQLVSELKQVYVYEGEIDHHDLHDALGEKSEKMFDKAVKSENLNEIRFFSYLLDYQLLDTHLAGYDNDLIYSVKSKKHRVLKLFMELYFVDLNTIKNPYQLQNHKDHLRTMIGLAISNKDPIAYEIILNAGVDPSMGAPLNTHINHFLHSEENTNKSIQHKILDLTLKHLKSNKVEFLSGALEASVYLDDPLYTKKILDYNFKFPKKHLWEGLKHSIIYNNLELASLFLEYGADPNFKEDGYPLALNLVLEEVDTKQYEFLKLLLEHNANPRYRNSNRKSAITLMKAHPDKRVVDLASKY